MDLSLLLFVLADRGLLQMSKLVGAAGLVVGPALFGRGIAKDEPAERRGRVVENGACVFDGSLFFALVHRLPANGACSGGVPCSTRLF
jgi:hypothetical protein